MGSVMLAIAVVTWAIAAEGITVTYCSKGKCTECRAKGHLNRAFHLPVNTSYKCDSPFLIVFIPKILDERGDRSRMISAQTFTVASLIFNVLIDSL